MEDMTTSQLLDQARAIMKDQTVIEEMAAASISTAGAADNKIPNVKRRKGMRYYRCSGWNHISKDCPVRLEYAHALQQRRTRATMSCFRYHGLGHIDLV